MTEQNTVCGEGAKVSGQGHLFLSNAIYLMYYDERPCACKCGNVHI